jgi:hypothetical protein
LPHRAQGGQIEENPRIPAPPKPMCSGEPDPAGSAANDGNAAFSNGGMIL